MIQKLKVPKCVCRSPLAVGEAAPTRFAIFGPARGQIFGKNAENTKNISADHPSRLWKRPPPFSRYLAPLGAKYINKRPNNSKKKKKKESIFLFFGGSGRVRGGCASSRLDHGLIFGNACFWRLKAPKTHISGRTDGGDSLYKRPKKAICLLYFTICLALF